MGTIFIEEFLISYLEHKRNTPTVQSVVCHMENLNKEIFSTYLIPGVNEATIEEQIKHVWESKTWATHVEVLATATIFQTPVFYSTEDSEGSLTSDWRNE